MTTSTFKYKVISYLYSVYIHEIIWVNNILLNMQELLVCESCESALQSMQLANVQYVYEVIGVP